MEKSLKILEEKYSQIHEEHEVAMSKLQVYESVGGGGNKFNNDLMELSQLSMR